MRMPEVTNGLLVSKGMVLRFTVMLAASSISWASLPVTSLFERSTSMRWLSVQPETRVKPRERNSSAMALAFLTI